MTIIQQFRRLNVANVLICSVLACSTAIATAQTGQGSITGRVTDPAGAVVVHANVQVMNMETTVVRSTKTNGEGVYTVVSLNPATYRVSVSMNGFQRSDIDGVPVQAAQTASIDVIMKLGQETSTITVTAQEALLSKDTSDVTTTVDHELVLALPYPERSALGAALLVPGVVGDAIYPGGIQSENPTLYTNAVAPGSSISIAGGAPGTASIMVDGSDVTQASFARAGVNLSGQIVQETTVVTGGMSAKYGRSSGGSIVQTSKPGTNRYHGSVTWRHTDPFFQAPPLTGTNTPAHLHEQFYGFYIGGPVWIPKLYDGHHKTFFFVGVEPARLSNLIGARGSFFTPADLAGDLKDTLPLLNQSILKFQGYAAAVAAPRTGSLYYRAPTNAQNFPQGTQYTNGNNVVIANNNVSAQLALNPFASFVMSQMPTPSNPGPHIQFDNPNGTYQNDLTNATYERGVQNFDNRYSFRIDHQFGDRDQMYFRYTVIPVSAQRFLALDPSNPLTQVPTDAARTHDFAVGYTHVFSNAVVNNAHYSFMRVNQVRGTPISTQSQDFGAKYGLPAAVSGFGFPSLGNFNVTGTSYTLSPGTTAASTQLDQNFIFADDVTWTHGRHLFQFGADARWIQSNQYNNGFTAGGSYTFSQGSTSLNGTNTGGAPLASFDLGLISTYAASPIAVPAYYRWRYDAAYFQDDWRITSNVTLNLGLRYNVETPRMEKFGNQPIAVFSPSTMNGISTSTAFCFSNGCPGVGKTLWPTNWKGIEPRIGLSFAPTPRTTLRGSYALSRMPLTGYSNLPLPDLSGTGSVGGINGGVTPNQVVDYITNPAASTSITSAYQSLNGNRGPITSSTGLTPIYVNQTSAVPYTQTWNLTVQYQPASSTLLQVTYQGLKGTHLIAPVNGGQYGDLNQPSIATLTAAVQANTYLSGTLPSCATPTAAPATCGNPYRILTYGSTTSYLTETALQGLNPYQNFYQQTLADDFERDGTSEYNGFLASVNHHEGRNLSILASYSWTKSLDNVANTTGANNASSGGSPAPQNPFDLAHEWSVSVYDQPSRLKVGYNYVLPIGKGQKFATHVRWVDNLIGNFSTSGNYTAASGFPNFVIAGNTGYFTSVTPGNVGTCTPKAPSTVCTSTAFPVGYMLRPNRVPGVPVINPNWKRGGGGVFSSTFVPYINPAAFTTAGTPGNPALGNAPRTLSDARSPREAYFDMRVVKGFVLHERYHLNLTGTFNNIFNHPVYFAMNASSKNLYTSTTATTSPTAATSTTPFIAAGTVTPSNGSAAFGQMTNNVLNFSRIIRIGAEFTF